MFLFRCWSRCYQWYSFKLAYLYPVLKNTIHQGDATPKKVTLPAVNLARNQNKANMNLISLIFVLAAIGVILWLVNTYVPMDEKIKSILNAVVMIAVVLWLLSLFVDMAIIHVGR